MVRVSATKPEDLGPHAGRVSIPGAHMLKERTNSYKLSSDFHIGTMSHTQAHKINKTASTDEAHRVGCVLFQGAGPITLEFGTVCPDYSREQTSEPQRAGLRSLLYTQFSGSDEQGRTEGAF